MAFLSGQFLVGVEQPRVVVVTGEGTICACDSVTAVHSRTHQKRVGSEPGVEGTATCPGRAPGSGGAPGHETSPSGISVLSCSFS